MDPSDAIPIVDVGALAPGAEAHERGRADEIIAEAATHSGFMVLCGLPEATRLDGQRRSALLRFFELSEQCKRRLYRRRYEPANANRYRGLAPLRPEEGIGTENLDIGPDAVDPGRGDPSDVLCEASAWPQEADLPGWRAEVARAFAGFESLGKSLVASLERGLGLPSGRLLHGFERGNSTMTLARHPEPGEFPESIVAALEVYREREGRWLQLVLPHADSGCITFVSQDEGAGLEARGRNGSWIPVPSAEGHLAVNFGHLLELWTGGEIVATEHRVVGTERRRTSLPFFFEPAVDAWIEPLPGFGTFEPVRYGDYVWKRMQAFPDYQNLGPRWTHGAS